MFWESLGRFGSLAASTVAYKHSDLSDLSDLSDKPPAIYRHLCRPQSAAPQSFPILPNTSQTPPVHKHANQQPLPSASVLLRRDKSAFVTLRRDKQTAEVKRGKRALAVLCGLSCSQVVFCNALPAGVYFCTRPSEHRSKAQNAPREPQNKKTSDCGNNRRFVNKISGVVLLSHTHMCSTIAAGALNYRVREGNVCCFSAIDTRKNFQY